MQKSKLLHCAKILRKKATKAENILWQAIRNRNFMNIKFRRQYWIGNYITDFACLEYKLIIELDGNFHLEQQEYDAIRSYTLSVVHFKVLRFWNWEILNDLTNVLENIAKSIECPSRR